MLRLNIDLKRIGKYLSDNNLWAKSFKDLSEHEIKNMVSAFVYITSTWPPDVANMIQWLKDENTEIPKEFKIDKTKKITDGPAYKEKLLLEIKQGPSSPRAFYGVLQSEIRQLYSLFGPMPEDDIPF